MRIRWRGLELPSRVAVDRETRTGYYGKFVAEPGPQPRADGTIRGALNIPVDDGVYAVQVTVAQWDETF